MRVFAILRIVVLILLPIVIYGGVSEIHCNETGQPYNQDLSTTYSIIFSVFFFIFSIVSLKMADVLHSLKR